METKDILIIGYVQQKDKTNWEKVKDNLIFKCPINANPYVYFPTMFKELFENWLVEFIELKE